MGKLITSFALAFLVGATPAEPCVHVYYPHELEAAEQQLDVTPPSQIEAQVVRIQRGHGPFKGVSTSCDDIGEIEIELLRFEDNRTPTDKLGYRVALDKGPLPTQFRLPDAARRVWTTPNGRPRLTLSWVDGETDEQEAFDFTLVITAIDLAGHESRASAPVRIMHPGSRLIR